MLDVGWTELLLIGVVALIVIGPKDLPVMFHSLGRITARARGMAREFSSAIEDAAKASGIHEATREISDLKKMASPRGLGLDALTRAADKFEKWDPLEPVRDATSAVPDPAAPPPAAPAATTSTSAASASAAASVSPATSATPAAGSVRPASAAPGSTVSGLGLGLPDPAPDARPAPSAVATASAASGAPGPAHQPGARRLHAVRRSDRS
ncbi:Sec-independent protein translocase protein TatB [Paracoccus sanguinis]|uniref:Sec-independent protein translocase protein TatB n=1 Tax=Paracoccus sanguinis TaxID=1545044 RepID=A0A1H2SD12_9RHOB|nr:Sec-independent protein translocase protein TatB [Paracoccus sanguinis]SDW28859.1 sec-independent protein translocase protein TatB [Paracoccus sanguinis]